MNQSDEPRLVLISGPAGVGKTTCARAVFDRLLNSALLDIDTLVTVYPFEVGPALYSLAARNVAAVANNMIADGPSTILRSLPAASTATSRPCSFCTRTRHSSPVTGQLPAGCAPW